MKPGMDGERDGTGHTPLGVSRLSRPSPACPVPAKQWRWTDEGSDGDIVGVRFE